jgi:hypothetical protein
MNKKLISCEETLANPHCHCPRCADYFNTLVHPLQDPKEGQGDVWADVLKHMPESPFKDVCRARRKMGIAKYGQPLQYGDGRDPIVDLFQELLDAIVYAKKAASENKIHSDYFFAVCILTEELFNLYIKNSSTK